MRGRRRPESRAPTVMFASNEIPGVPMHRPPTFDPPFESPAEEQFSWSFVKLLDQRCVFDKQVTVETARGRFRLDFVLTCPDGLRIGIEIDGIDFHDHRRDAWRDAMVLGEHHVDGLLRFAARDVYYRIFDTIAVIR